MDYNPISCLLGCPVCKVGSIRILDTGDMNYSVDIDTDELIPEGFSPDEGVGWVALCLACARTFEAEIDWDNMKLLSLKGHDIHGNG